MTRTQAADIVGNLFFHIVNIPCFVFSKQRVKAREIMRTEFFLGQYKTNLVGAVHEGGKKGLGRLERALAIFKLREKDLFHC